MRATAGKQAWHIHVQTLQIRQDYISKCHRGSFLLCRSQIYWQLRYKTRWDKGNMPLFSSIFSTHSAYWTIFVLDLFKSCKNIFVLNEVPLLELLPGAKELMCTWHYFPVPPYHDDVIKWKHFPRYWPFVRGIHRSPVNSPHKGQWRGALMFFLICTRINGWVNNGETGDLRRYRAHCDVTVM